MLDFESWGLIDYKSAWEKQKELVKSVQKGDRNSTLVLCEHPTVITMGRNGDYKNILFKPEFLKQMNVDIVEIERGGDVTIHNPGQLVGYPIFNLTNYRQDLHWFLREIEQLLIDLVSQYGIIGGRVEGMTGVWVQNKRKIAAIGMHCSRWVISHGFALNVCNNLMDFSYIVPCGIQTKEVTSIFKEIGTDIDIKKVESDCAGLFFERFG